MLHSEAGALNRGDMESTSYCLVLMRAWLDEDIQVPNT